jgi:3-oxoacyl-[acyl-carrier protein] reductase
VRTYCRPRERDVMTRTAVVTGGGTGLGRAIAHRLAVEGVDVMIVGRREEVLRKAAESINSGDVRGTVSYCPVDLLEPRDLERMVSECGDALDILVNNAGGNPGVPLDSLESVAANYRAAFDGNVITAVLATHALLPIVRRPGGRIVSISSIAGLRGGAGSYGASKAALHAWNMELALALAPLEITANVVAPGFVPDTEYWTGMTQAEADTHVVRIPMGRGGTPQEVAAMVAYLAAEDAGWTTGQILQVNGGALLGRG